jgi:hypothetical protein
MVKIFISPDAARHVHSKGIARPNIVIYRDIIFAGPSAPGAFSFLTKVKLKDQEPDGLFTVVGSTYNIPIWVERGLLPTLDESASLAVTLKGGILKRLGLEECPQVEEIGSEQITK